jgi:nucleoside-diphosphate-sugar epimerase
MAGQRLAVIIGATGPTGIQLARELLLRGDRVRVVSRRTENLQATFIDLEVEAVAADALDGEATRAAVAGADLVFDCIGLPADHMHLHPRAASSIAAAARRAGARCVQVSSFWPYLPARRLPVDESHPRVGGNDFIRARREAEDVMLSAGAAVANLPDFFGPHVHTSTLQRPLEEAAAGSAMSFMGPASVEREYVFIPDAMAAVARLADHEEAYGRAWIIPGSGPLSARHAAAIAGDHLGREVKVRAAPGWMLRLLALVSSDLRAFAPMLPYYTRPIRFHAGRLGALLGEIRTTPYEHAIPATLDWIGAQRSRMTDNPVSAPA